MLCYLKSGPPLVTSSGYERLINILVDPVRLRVGPHHKISNLQCYRRTRLDYRRTPRKGWIPPHTGPSSKIAYLCRRSTTCLLEENDTKVTIPWYINVKYGVSVCVCAFFPFILGVMTVGRTSRGYTGGRSHEIAQPPSFRGACLDFSREKDSAVPFPRRS